MDSPLLHSLSAQLLSVKPGEYIPFGHSSQDAAKVPQPIEWMVLAREPGRLLLISWHVLAHQPYHAEQTTITWETLPCTAG